jgi:hypothetical protein
VERCRRLRGRRGSATREASMVGVGIWVLGAVHDGVGEEGRRGRERWTLRVEVGRMEVPLSRGCFGVE